MANDPCCAFSCVKGSLVTFNFIFWFSGPGVLGLSIWFYLTTKMYSPILDMTSYAAPAYVMMAAGAVSIVAGVCGCLGGINENKCLIFFFTSSLVVVFGCQIYPCVATFYLYNSVDSEISRNLNYSIYTLYHYTDDTTTAMDKIQQELHCCGYIGPSDWRYTAYYNDVTLSATRGREVLPESCCYDTTDAECNVGDGIPQHPGQIFTEGCYNVLKDWNKNMLLIFGWGAFTLSAFELVGIVLSCCLYRAVLDKYER